MNTNFSSEINQEQFSMPIWRRKMGQLMQRADQLIAFSRNTADLYARTFPAIKRKIRVIIHILLKPWTVRR